MQDTWPWVFACIFATCLAPCSGPCWAALSLGRRQHPIQLIQLPPIPARNCQKRTLSSDYLYMRMYCIYVCKCTYSFFGPFSWVWPHLSCAHPLPFSPSQRRLTAELRIKRPCATSTHKLVLSLLPNPPFAEPLSHATAKPLSSTELGLVTRSSSLTPGSFLPCPSCSFLSFARGFLVFLYFVPFPWSLLLLSLFRTPPSSWFAVAVFFSWDPPS